MVNRIQKTRKDSNLNVADRIEVTIHTTDELAKVFEKFQSYISTETLMVKGNISPTTIPGSVLHDIDENKFEMLWAQFLFLNYPR